MRHDCGMINTVIFGLNALLFQEMMGLTYFMLDQSRKEAEYCMENAFSTYYVWFNFQMITFSLGVALLLLYSSCWFTRS